MNAAEKTEHTREAASRRKRLIYHKERIKRAEDEEGGGERSKQELSFG